MDLMLRILLGLIFAILLHELGVKILAVSDSKGGIYSKEGVDPSKVLEHKQKTGSVVKYHGCKNITNDSVYLNHKIPIKPTIFKPKTPTPTVTRILVFLFLTSFIIRVLSYLDIFPCI